MSELMPQSSPSTDRAVASGQLFIAILVLALIGAVAAAANWCERHDEWLLNRRMAEWKQNNATYLDGRYFDNPEERLLYHTLPRLDFSRGGVWFFGSSPSQQAILPWEFPKEIQPRIENFSMAAANHDNEFRFIRCMAEYNGMLQAGGEKSLVVIELFFGSSCHATTPSQQYMQDVWHGYFTRYGLYGFDAGGELSPVEMNPIHRWFNLQTIRSHVFLSWLMRHDNNYFKPPEHSTDAEIVKYWTDRLGPGWQSGMDSELASLAQAIDYLKSRNAKVAGFYFPERRWARNYPPAIRYRDKVISLMSAKSVSVLDLKDSFDETQFVDSVHLNYQGSMKLQPSLIDLAMRHLRP